MKRHTTMLTTMLLLACLALPGAAAGQEEPPYYAESYGDWKVAIHDVTMNSFWPCLGAGKIAVRDLHGPVRLFDVNSGTSEVVPDSGDAYVEACAPDASFLIVRKKGGKEFTWHIIDRIAGRLIDLPSPGPYETPYSNYPGSLLSPDGTRLLGPASWGDAVTLPSGKRLAVIPFDSPAVRHAAGVPLGDRFPFAEAYWSKDSKQILLLDSEFETLEYVLAVLDVATIGKPPVIRRIPYSDGREGLNLYSLATGIFLADYFHMDLDAPSTWGLLRVSAENGTSKDFRVQHCGINATRDGRILYLAHHKDGEHDTYELSVVDTNLDAIRHMGRIFSKDGYPMVFPILPFAGDKIAVMDMKHNKIIMFSK